MTIDRRLLAWGLIAILPLVILAVLLQGVIPDPKWAGPTFHFYIVSFTAGLAFVIALLMRFAAGQLADARVLLLSLAYLAISGIFLTHALMTPGGFVAMNPWVGFSSRLSLFVGAIFLALATLDWKPAFRRAIVQHQTLITGLFGAVLVAYALLAFSTAPEKAAGTAPAAATSAAPATQSLAPSTRTVSGESDYGYGEPIAQSGSSGAAARAGASHSHAQDAAQPGARASSTPFPSFFAFINRKDVSYLTAGLTIALLGLVILRYSQIYRSERLPVATGFLAGAIFLSQAQISMTIAPNWHASWWEYHILMLVAFATAVLGLGREYLRSGSLQGVVGNLLLRDTVVQLQRGYTDVIVALVEAVEAKDPYTRGHTQRVAELSVLIGQELQLSPEQLRTLNQAAMLHDIGKIGIPDSILNKPGPLLPEEFAIIKEHPARGHRIIEKVRSLQPEIGGVRHHHERLDGSGYPDGLRGQAIPLSARIIAVADVFDALTSARPYRGPWSVERALEILDSEAGTKLDPGCVAALRRALPVWTGRVAKQAATPTLAPPVSTGEPAIASASASAIH